MEISVIPSELLILIPVTIGVVQVIKELGVQNRYAPLVSLVIGVAGVFLLGDISKAAIIQGLIVGLVASGLWSGVKTSLGF